MTSAEDWDVSTFTDSFDVRIYATNLAHPERGPALVVTAYPDIVGSPGPHPETVEVRGVIGDLTDTVGGSRTLVFFVDGYIYSLTAFNMTDEQLLALAESARPSADGNGAVVDHAALPDGVIEQLVGWRETSFVSSAASATIAPRVELNDPTTGSTATYLSFADPGLARLSRLAYGRINETTVNGQPAYIASTNDPRYSTVVWAAGSRTVFLSGSGFSNDELLAIAESLRPISDTEWAAMQASVADAVGPCAPVTYSPTTTCVVPG